MMGANDDEFTRYVKSTRPALRRTAFRFTADWHEADDLVQRTLLALYLRWDKLERRDRIAAYAYTTMTRLFVSDRRSLRWSNEVLYDQPPDLEPVPDTGAVYGDRLLLAAALAGLAPRQRAAVVLRYGYDLAYGDIAEALGSSELAARQATSSGIRRLRREEGVA